MGKRSTGRIAGAGLRGMAFRGAASIMLLWLVPLVHGAEAIDFRRDIHPILVDHCYECHGPGDQQGDLRLDSRPTSLDSPSAESDPLIVAGDAEASPLWERVASDDPSWRMPPDREPLTSNQIDALRQWIQQGAVWPEDASHWAFVPPAAAAVPAVEDPAGWVRGGIDAFILQRLRREGLQPAPEADRSTLLRRLHLDLVGLPPTVEELQSFMTDSSADAYERRVEALLASPRYGERWAARWLDLARYGDTDGYDYDRERPMWLYRDWVIAAFNRDLPYDQFAAEQLAGDLLPEATDDQQIATGFIRNSAVPMYRFDLLVDRVSTVGTVFLGISLECAQCHDHKFDPVSQEEFYQLFAMFNNDDDAEVEVASPLTGARGKTLVVKQRAEPRTTHVAIGGSFLNPGAEVQPAAPRGLYAADHRDVDDRLGLARWLTDSKNPLLARVAVNRQWELLFGEGLVVTSEDLGTRTATPEHPELLDWLAVRFIEQGWSLKQLHRLLVTSATYRQDSTVTPELESRDPNNRLWARGSRFRVDAESVRDLTLAAAGLLEHRIGGPSVFPYQPKGISENRERGAYGWQQSEGAEQYRRGLYTHWKRAALYPGLSIFDAPRRETSCARRLRSNNPLQALATLNDPAYFEAAIHLGRLMADAKQQPAAAIDPDPAIHIGFLRCVARPPTAAEQATLGAFYQRQYQRFLDDPAAARELLAQTQTPLKSTATAAAEESSAARDHAHWAACTMLANVLLNLDETITRP